MFGKKEITSKIAICKYAGIIQFFLFCFVLFCLCTHILCVIMKCNDIEIDIYQLQVLSDISLFIILGYLDIKKCSSMQVSLLNYKNVISSFWFGIIRACTA